MRHVIAGSAIIPMVTQGCRHTFSVQSFIRPRDLTRVLI